MLRHGKDYDVHLIILFKISFSKNSQFEQFLEFEVLHLVIMLHSTIIGMPNVSIGSTESVCRYSTFQFVNADSLFAFY